MELKLSGLDSSELSTSLKESLIAAVAAAAGVDPSDVRIVSVTVSNSRRLLQESSGLSVRG